MTKRIPLSDLSLGCEELVSIKERLFCLLERKDHYNFCLTKWALQELGYSVPDIISEIGKEKTIKILNGYFRSQNFMEFVIMASAAKATGDLTDESFIERKRASIDEWQRGALVGLKRTKTAEGYFCAMILTSSLQGLGFCPEPVVWKNAAPFISEYIKKYKNSDHPEMALAAKAAIKAIVYQGIVIY
jgi:hypothetical protein